MEIVLISSLFIIFFLMACVKTPAPQSEEIYATTPMPQEDEDWLDHQLMVAEGKYKQNTITLEEYLDVLDHVSYMRSLYYMNKPLFYTVKEIT